MKISQAELDTIQYYDDHAEEFYHSTVNADVTELYQLFIEKLPPGGTILDAGCGSGRDSLYFLKQGFLVTPIDASVAMVEKCSQLTGVQAQQLPFNQVDFDSAFDGIWACASLLHIPRSSIDEILVKFTKAMKPSAFFYSSFKYGDKEEIRKGRLFNSYREDSFQELIAQHKQLELVKIWRTTDVRPRRDDEYWLNALLRKRVDP
ncbi:methyltransferase domain-containing protein [Heliorestis acidaminivorans]|uniref:Methyltransferase domain-containing protein n=1 Tax=Heliorestis acidaminivorans TaxID=553427 RepID=A0A6I0F5G9_9FIRM|nr:class I SAM-dependent methyltransferase [Heliorestis acidaminivorans]KAB2954242.1 methyltransferase domain-containing protein [Heliorestis acidaminivorans]